MERSFEVYIKPLKRGGNSVLTQLKKMCPGLYKLYKHFRGQQKIKEIDALKKYNEIQRKEFISDLYMTRIGHELN